MSIKELPEKIKVLSRKMIENEKDIFLGLLVLIVGFGGFLSGRLIQIEDNRTPVEIEMVDLDNENIKPEIIVKTQTGESPLVLNKNQVANVANAIQSEGKEVGVVVGSRNGDKYHLPGCSGASRIKEENKVWFTTIEDAKKAGYTAAANCPGLQ